MRIRAKARVQVTIEVEASVWGDDCTIGQLYKQAASDGVTAVSKLLHQTSGATIVGHPNVIGIITEAE